MRIAIPAIQQHSHLSNVLLAQAQALQMFSETQLSEICSVMQLYSPFGIGEVVSRLPLVHNFSNWHIQLLAAWGHGHGSIQLSTHFDIAEGLKVQFYMPVALPFPALNVMCGRFIVAATASMIPGR